MVLTVVVVVAAVVGNLVLAVASCDLVKLDFYMKETCGEIHNCNVGVCMYIRVCVHMRCCTYACTCAHHTRTLCIIRHA